MTTNNYILTYSGREVAVAGDTVPTLYDIGLALSRIPRFAGHGRTWWSVLDHTLFCYDLAREGALPFAFPALPLAMLLHDAHEAVTSDIPTPIKSTDMANAQWLLDLKLMDAYFPGGHDAYDFQHETVKKVDRAALLVEALRVGPPALKLPSDVAHHFGGAPRLSDIAVWENAPKRPSDRAWHYSDLVIAEQLRLDAVSRR